MKKETIGFIVGMIILFGGYILIQNHYAQNQQAAIQNQPIPTQNQPSAATINPPAEINPPKTQDTNSTEPSIADILKTQEQTPLIATAEDLKVTLNKAEFEFTPTGGCIGRNVLINEHVAYDNQEPISIITNYNICKAYGFRVANTDLRIAPAGITKTNTGATQIVQRTDSLEITRTFSFDKNDYLALFKVNIKNISNTIQNTSVDFELGASSDEKSGGMFSAHQNQFHAISARLSDDTIKRIETPFDKSPDYKILFNQVGINPTWLDAGSLYWVNTLIPLFHTPIDFQVIRTGYNLAKSYGAEVNQTVYEAWVRQPVHLNPGQSTNFDYKIFMGPKSESILKNYEEYHLNDTIDYGFFRIVARPMYFILSFLHGLIANWGVSIILLTVLINIVFLPLQIKAYGSAQKMQKIQPKIKELQQKYKDDKVALQKETMALMAQGGVNPISGCLPLLPQIPVFFALDSALRHTFDLRQSPFFFWIHDLTQADPYFVLPILMAFLMIGYQRMIPMPSMDPSQAKMMKILPIVFSVFMIFYPAGLAIYVITNTIISMIRQSFLIRHYKKINLKT